MKTPVIIRRCCLLLIVALSVAAGASAQHNPYDYYLNDGQEASGYSLGDYHDLFYMPLENGQDVFSRLSNFNFSTVRYSRRGYPSEIYRNTMSGMDISGGLTASTDYSLYSTLRRSRTSLPRFGGVWVNEIHGMTYEQLAGASRNHASFYIEDSRTTVSLHATDRKGRVGGRIQSSGPIGKKAKYLVMAYRRWGRDAAVDGVFTDETSFLAEVGIKLSATQRLNFMVLGAATENGLRSSATREAFELTGNNLYNPSWGYFEGEQRNSRVTERFQPMFLIDYGIWLSTNTSMGASASYRFGRKATSGLAWFSSPTPYPDYYRDMPSYTGNKTLEELWRSGDAKVTQLDWDEMYGINLRDGDGQSYALEERVEEVGDMQASVYGSTYLNRYATIFFGATMRREDTNYYKRMKDRMGSAPRTDLDQYLYDDHVYKNSSLNDVRNPDRLIRDGDRFGYDYNIYGNSWSVYAGAQYDRGALDVSGNISVGGATLQRRGNYEKQLYPGEMSYGRSKKLSFDTYDVTASARYTISPKHILSARGRVAALAPWYGNVFVSPSYVNKTVDSPDTRKFMTASLEYRTWFHTFRFEASLFYSRLSDGSDVYGYYDDIGPVYGGKNEPTYSDMLLTGVDKQFYGVEIGASYDISSRLSLNVAFATGRYEYCSDPEVTILDDATMEAYVVGAKSYLDGYRVGSSPETVLSTELRYSSHGWRVSLTYNYMGGRYVAPNPHRRTERIYNLAGSPERFVEFVAQEKLDAAQTLDLFAMKSFYISKNRKHRMSVLLSVNNLLNNKDIVYNGYEQMRVLRRGTAPNMQYTPFPSKYTYSKGRTWYAALTYAF